MVIATLLTVWAFLMVRACVAEYKYYQSVKTLEPQIWIQLGSPSLISSPITFITPAGSKRLAGVTNLTVKQLAYQHRLAGIQFLGFVAMVLVGSIVYFKIV